MRLIKQINGPYAQAFNRRWGRYGPLFQGRFEAVPIFNMLKVVETSCYIHQNPVTAHMVDHPSEFEWTSFRHYAEDCAVRPAWLDPNFVLNILKAYGPDTRRQYADIMTSYRGDDRDSWVSKLRTDASAALLSA